MISIKKAFALVTVFVLPLVVSAQTSATDLDIPALIRECERNLDSYQGIYDYSFVQTKTIRHVNKRGEVTKQEIKVSKAYPTRNRRNLIYVKISENGAARSPQQIAAERERAAKEIEKAEKRKQPEKYEDPDQSGYVRLGFKDFFRAGEFGSPRRVKFRDRDALILDFRPRPDFRPTTRMQTVVSALVGSVWIDPEKKEVIRLEAYPPEAAGYRASSEPMGIIRPHAAVVFERKPTPEGVWVQTLWHIDTVSRPGLFNDTPLNITFEFSDYRHFGANVERYEIKETKP